MHAMSALLTGTLQHACTATLYILPAENKAVDMVGSVVFVNMDIVGIRKDARAM